MAEAAFCEVSVVIPAYRAEATIGRALASVAAQTLKPRRAIVVVDGSPDGTAAAARKPGQAMEGIELTVLEQPNRGAGAARNRGIGLAETEYVAFLDADDEWLPEKLARSMAHLDGGDTVLVAHDFLWREAGKETPIACSARFAEGPDPYATLYRKGYIGTSMVVARRDALIAAGGFDETLPNAQDFDLWLEMLKPPGAPFLVFAERLAIYHVTEGSIMSNVERRLRCSLTIARRHAPGLADLLVRVLAVHYEAFNAYLARRDYAAALGVCLRAPVSLSIEAAAYFSGGGNRHRRRFPGEQA